jgi:hypothetical protein
MFMGRPPSSSSSGPPGIQAHAIDLTSDNQGHGPFMTRALSTPAIIAWLLIGAAPALADCNVFKAMLTRQGKALEDAMKAPAKLAFQKIIPGLNCWAGRVGPIINLQCMRQDGSHALISDAYFKGAKITGECGRIENLRQLQGWGAVSEGYVLEHHSEKHTYLRAYDKANSYQITSSMKYYYERKIYEVTFKLETFPNQTRP